MCKIYCEYIIESRQKTGTKQEKPNYNTLFVRCPDCSAAANPPF